MSAPPLQRRLFTRFLSKQVPPIPLEDEREFYPLKTANPLSTVFFTWLFPLMNKGYKRTLEVQDMFRLTDDLKVDANYERFMGYFRDDFLAKKQAHIEAKCKNRDETMETSTVDKEEDLEDFVYPRLRFIWICYKTFWMRYTLSLALQFVCVFLEMFTPQTQKYLIDYVSEREENPHLGAGKGVGYAFAIALVIYFSALINLHSFFQSFLIGGGLRSVLIRLVLEKSFNQSDSSKHNFPVGKITTMVGADISRIDFSIRSLNILLSTPIPVVVGFVLLPVNIGVSSLAGIGVFILGLGILSLAPKILSTLRKTANTWTEKRVNLVTELLQNFKTVKFYAWEPSYIAEIRKVRTLEMNKIYLIQLAISLFNGITFTMPGICSMVSFIILFRIDKSRSTGSIFSSLNLFEIMALEFIMVPQAIATCTDAYVGFGRIVEFISSGDARMVEPTEEINHTIEDMRKTDSVVRVVGASFEWKTFEAEAEDDDTATIFSVERDVLEEDSKEADVNSVGGQTLRSDLGQTAFPGLNDIDLDIKRGEFVVVTGSIGSGKSSLLCALAGFMHRTKGHVATIGDVLLCGTYWIQNTTIRENILFGSSFDQEKYEKVINACALEPDFDILPAGDMTEVGEKGITLSGGQKARICLARAVYANKDILLLDDVLSAVDARVGKHIVENCLMGLSGGKTRLLATHQLSLISFADKIIFLNGDGSIDYGTIEDLKDRNSRFARLMEFNPEDKANSEDDEDEQEAEEAEILKQQSKRSDLSRKEAGRIMLDEDRGVNSTGFDVYKRYVQLGQGIFGIAYLPLLLIVVSCTAFVQIFVNAWLSFWISGKFAKSDGFYTGIYAMLTGLVVVFLATESAFVSYMTNNASKVININAMERIMFVPMSFMDTTPLGRILNRFTKDTETMDTQLPELIRICIQFLGSLIGVIILCIIYLPWIAIAIPILTVAYIVLVSYELASAREIKRLEALKRSYVFSNFNESLAGQEVIKAYRAEERFLEKNNVAIDTMNECTYVMSAVTSAFAIHTTGLGCFITLAVGLLSNFRVFHISPSAAGLLMSYVISASQTINVVISTLTQIQNTSSSVERLEYYGFRLPQEAPYVLSPTPDPDWPQRGHITFDNVTLRYRPGLPAVLQNLNLNIKPGEKIGICGRTGAGKSTIMTALYRIAEVDEGGKIVIDDIDISSLGVGDLRSRLSIIPQDPVLFRGTIRSNLDPFNERSDNTLWKALVSSGLIESSRIAQVKSQTAEDKNLHKFHLLQNVENDGSNFSLGERQLISLARALVRNSKILILDEATSSVDYETDSKIQNTIASEFGECTILCIAHRLRTILNYDRILVMDKGELHEFDTPWALYSDSNSIFKQMCDKSGITRDDFEVSINFGKY